MGCEDRPLTPDTYQTMMTVGSNTLSKQQAMERMAVVRSVEQKTLLGCEFRQRQGRASQFVGVVTYETLDAAERTMTALFVSGFYSRLRTVSHTYKNSPIAFCNSYHMVGNCSDFHRFEMNGAAIYVTQPDAGWMAWDCARIFVSRMEDKFLAAKGKLGYVHPSRYHRNAADDRVSSWLTAINGAFQFRDADNWSLSTQAAAPVVLPPPLPPPCFDPFGPRRRRIILDP